MSKNRFIQEFTCLKCRAVGVQRVFPYVVQPDVYRTSDTSVRMVRITRRHGRLDETTRTLSVKPIVLSSVLLIAIGAFSHCLLQTMLVSKW
jgi:hypothetical protein